MSEKEPQYLEHLPPEARLREISKMKADIDREIAILKAEANREDDLAMLIETKEALEEEEKIAREQLRELN